MLTADRSARRLAWAERIGAKRERSRAQAERLRVARELHDVLGFGLATISLQAGVAAHVLDQHPEQVLEALQAIKAASREALEEVRGILGLLRHSDGLRDDPPGIRELDSLADTMRKSGVPTRLEVLGRPPRLPLAVDRAAYRIVQEALANVLRHARAASVSVSVAFGDDRLCISIENDGNGFANGSREASRTSGYGIVGMRERALALGGSLEAGPRAEGGFRVRASLPVGGCR